jgi:Uma2 family endonuclease
MSLHPVKAGIPPLPIRPFTVDEYHRLAEAGILRDGERVELLQGWLVPKMTHNPPHASSLSFVLKELGRRLPAGWHPRVQLPITTTDSEPEPDYAVIRGDERLYTARHPGPTEVGLLVEIADTTLRGDREAKGPMYAAAAVPVYWIVNLVDRCVEVYTDPTGPADEAAYRRRRDYSPEQAVPLIFDGAEHGSILVRDLLP